MGYGLGAMNSVGNSMRDYRQEGEIQQSRMELEDAKRREADLEARLRMLEMQQGRAPAPVLQQLTPAPAQ